MNKIKFLLSAAAVVAVIAGVTATQARTNAKIFVEKVPGSQDCPVLQTHSRLVSLNPAGINATLIAGPCPDKYITTAVPNN